MDIANHNVLQFVSAAAQVFETQEVEDMKGSASDLRCSTEAPLSNSSAWDIPDTHTDHDTDTKVTSEKPDEIRELLAEATGANIEESATASSSDSSVANDASIEDKLKRVFHLPAKESLRGEWPCYIVQSAIVPGFMYLTDNHICFYASLPKSQLVFHKSGYLQLKKAGTMKSTFERYFFDVNDDVLAWFESSTDSYSPLGKIDLKYAIAVRQSTKRKYGFRVVTMNKTWHFQADTNAAVIEWTNALQKAIFRAKNNGSSLKITLPFENILDIEQTEAFEFQKFLKIRAVGIDDSFVMDEYYFAYFSDIETTFKRLKLAWESYSRDTAAATASVGPNKLHSLTPDHDSSSNSPSLSISDLYDADSQPITIPAASSAGSIPAPKRSNSVVANALAVPGALKDFLYPSASSSKSTAASDKLQESFSSDDDDQSVGWLHGKRRSGMKLVYGLLGGNTMTGSLSTALATDDVDDDDDDDEEDNDDEEEHYRLDTVSSPRVDEAEILDDRTMTNFQKYFILPESEKLLTVYRCSLMKTLPCYGKLYISSSYISFNAKGFATKAKMIIPFQDVIRIQKLRSRGYIFHSLSILTQTKKEIYLEFSSITRRNSCFASLFLQHKRALESQMEPDKAEKKIKDWEARLMEDEQKDAIGRVVPNDASLPVLSRQQTEAIAYKKPEKSLHFTCITIGTRGDVQPYIALCKGLMKEGHRCRIATHDEFKDWIEEHGIEFRTVGGDPGELMRICVENNFFSVNFVVEGLRLFKDWIDELLTLSWKAVQGTEIIIESPSAMIGVHMAEALRVPYFRSFPMPMTRTRSFPHPFATPNNPKGRLYNDMTYVLFDHAVWRAIAARTNSFRKTTLGIPATSYEKLEVWKIPYLYSFSPSIVPSPLDWLDWIHCTGYWFLDNPQTGWTPDPELKAFIEAQDTRPIVYIGFGSIIVSDPVGITRVIIESVLLSNVRAIVSRGWSSRHKQGAVSEEADMLSRHPGTIMSVQSVPHDWLFPKIRAVVHHGGAGTTAAGLRAGRPTIIKPFFADQFFWGERVEEMGIGRCIKSLTVDNLSAALRVVSTDENMLKVASRVGQKICAETGVDTAIQCIYRDMELAKARTMSSILKTSKADDDIMASSFGEEDQDWTIIEDVASGSISPGSWKPTGDAEEKS
ncbi:glycosyltransferase family 1 protein [Mucor ambiguus]|uniref:sterol 3beta-glucosyltransferase n=1 Tax=Mucor ambiguus TaxID=91626 RepID=A0A0C9MJZ8_9FUNG|nr:glycosyltransferase family 1 protein [Mucor ambiguus]